MPCKVHKIVYPTGRRAEIILVEGDDLSHKPGPDNAGVVRAINLRSSTAIRLFNLLKINVLRIKNLF